MYELKIILKSILLKKETKYELKAVVYCSSFYSLTHMELSLIHSVSLPGEYNAAN